MAEQSIQPQTSMKATIVRVVVNLAVIATALCFFWLKRKKLLQVNKPYSAHAAWEVTLLAAGLLILIAVNFPEKVTKKFVFHLSIGILLFCVGEAIAITAPYKNVLVKMQINESRYAAYRREKTADFLVCAKALGLFGYAFLNMGIFRIITLNRQSDLIQAFCLFVMFAGSLYLFLPHIWMNYTIAGIIALIGLTALCCFSFARTLFAKKRT